MTCFGCGTCPESVSGGRCVKHRGQSLKFLERAEWGGGGAVTHLLSSLAPGQGLSSPHLGTPQHEDSDFPATEGGLGAREVERLAQGTQLVT